MLSVKHEQNEMAIDEQAEQYYEKYQDRFEILESSSIISEARSFDPYLVTVIGSQMDLCDEYMKHYEAKGSISDLGELPKLALDVISLFYGTSPISLIAGVQPLPDELGTVYRREIFSNTTKGNVTEGDKLISPVSPPDTVPTTTFAGSEMTETLGITVSGATSYGYILSNLPIRERSSTVSITVGSTILTCTDLNSSSGQLEGFDCQGQINYTTGAITIELHNDPSSQAGGNISITYTIDSERATDIPEIVDRLSPISVRAKTFVLKTTFGIIQDFVRAKRFGTSQRDDATKSLTGAINMEIVGLAISKLVAASTGTVTWYKTPTNNNFSFSDHKDTLRDAIADSEVNLVANSGRGVVINVHVIGRAIAAVVKTLIGFKKISDKTNYGPHLYGTLDGVPVIRVPQIGMLGANTMLNLFKGDEYDAPVVYGPFMPLVSTAVMPNGQNPLAKQKAAAVMAAVETLNPNLVTTLTMDPGQDPGV